MIRHTVPVLALVLVAGAASSTSLATTRGAARPTARAAADRCEQPGPYALPLTDEPVDLDPAEFTIRIDNPYWPMRPGTVWHYVEHTSGEAPSEAARVTVRVTRRTRLIEGVRVRVVRDVVRSADGDIEEATSDWYAQDSGGSIWYFGEFTQEFEDGEPVSSQGSFEHGKDGAQAGVVVPATPVAGCSYREEYKAGEAEDRATVLSTGERIRTRFGLRHHVLQTSNTSPLEPAVLENKLYVRGIGPVLEVDLSPQLGSAELVSITRP